MDSFAVAEDVVDLSALTLITLDKYRPLAEEKNLVIRDTVANDVSVRGDGALLRQVLGNLLSNAIKFSAPGGEIRVTLTKRALAVKDTGIGIAQDALPHIFDRFYQAETSRAKDGFGLGLSLVKRIVDLHGWTIAAKSREGKGAEFTVTFA